MSLPPTPSLPRFIHRRSFDKPWQWAFLFTLFAFATLPFYCITRRTWKPLFYVSGCFGSIALVWSFLVGFLDGLLRTNYQESPVAESLLVVGLIASIYGGGFYSVQALRRGAIETKKGCVNFSGGDVADSPSTSLESLLRSNSSSGSPLGRFRTKHYAVGAIIVVFLLTGSYAIHTTAVESTIKANPILASVAKAGVEVKIKHFDCGNMFGFYDSSTNTLQVCTSVHDDQLFSSKESTIRHEAWHLVQACSAVKSKDDEWGNFAVVDSPLLADKSLTPDDVKYIADNYDKESHGIESEALLAEMHLTDGQIIQAIEEKCYFPE